MAVIAVIQAAHKAYKVWKKFDELGNVFVRKAPPNVRPYIFDIKRGFDIVFAGSIFKEAVDYFYDGTIQTGAKTKESETRNNMEQPFSKRFRVNQNTYNKRYRSRKRYCKPRRGYR